MISCVKLLFNQPSVGTLEIGNNINVNKKDDTCIFMFNSLNRILSAGVVSQKFCFLLGYRDKQDRNDAAFISIS